MQTYERIPSVAALLATLALLATHAIASPQLPPSWSLISSVGPNPNYAPAMTHDTSRGRSVYFGKASLGATHGETWEWNGAAWIPMLFASGPAGRSLHSFAFHGGAGVAVLFSGSTNGTFSGLLSDTWTWDGQSWASIPSPTQPPGRLYGAMAYAPNLGGVMLYGGASSSAAGGQLNDLWVYDGNTWLEVTGQLHPPARSGHAMTFDAARGCLVVYGGHVGHWLQSSQVTDELWEFDGLSWTLRATPIHPGARHGHSMTYDPRRRFSVLYGGQNQSNDPTHNTWLWDGVRWLSYPYSGAHPGTTFRAAMTHDSDREITILLSSNISTTGTHGWTGDYTSTVNGFGTSCGLLLGAAPNDRPSIGSTMQMVAANNTLTSTITTYIAFGWSSSHIGNFALPLPLDGYGLTGCTLLQSSDSITTMQPSGPNQSQFGLNLPYWGALVGLSLYCQAFAFAPGYNPGNTMTSNAIHLGIGHTP